MLDFYFYKQLQSAQGLLDWTVKAQCPAGKLLAVYGASGTGKTTLLRLLAGLDQAQEGHLKLDGNCWYNSSKKINWTPQQRRVGVVFQDYALFPNMTVRQHLEFASKNQQLIQQLLEATDLQGLEGQRPRQLSGGQQQRLALARALALEPRLLLLDEPLSALDGPLRQQLQALLAELHHAWNCTTLLVSHDADEVLRLADHLLVLEAGKTSYYAHPAEYFQRQGLALALTAKVLAVEAAYVVVQLGDQVINVPLSAAQLAALTIGQRIELGSVHPLQLLKV